MSIFKTAYDTVGCPMPAGIKEIEDKLKAGHASHAFKHEGFLLENHEDPFYMELIQGGNTAADIVPYFSHPLFIRDMTSKKLVSYVDMRNFGKWHAPQQTFIVRNHPEYQWHLLRGLLNHIWIQERVELLRDVSTLPAAVYSALLSESIARKYALDPGEQAIISVVACYFYYCLFTDDKQFAEYDFDKLVGKIAMITKVPAKKVFDILDGQEVIHGLEKLCVVIQEKTNSIRLNDFNVGVLLAIVSGNWFGTNARENLAVGLEHIPTWLMICYASINETTFKRSVLAKLVERFAKGTVGVSFLRSMNALMDVENLFKEVE